MENPFTAFELTTDYVVLEWLEVYGFALEFHAGRVSGRPFAAWFDDEGRILTRVPWGEA